MDNNKIKILIFNIKDLFNDEIFKRCYLGIKVDRLKKIDAYESKDDQCLSLGGELLFKYALIKEGLNYNSCSIRYNRYQKPYIENSSFYYNISHSGDYVILGYSNSEIGVDIEKKRNVNLNIAERFFSPNEFDEIFTKIKEEQKNLFFKIWTLKEAYRKFKGLGLALSLDKDDYSSYLYKDEFEINKIHYFYLNNIEDYSISIVSTSKTIESIKILTINDLIKM